jgi:hypothetical protein
MSNSVTQQLITGGRPSDWEGKILPLRDQARITKGWMVHRLDTILPELMKRENLDMWLVNIREYNEGPVAMTLLPSPMLTARRRTTLIFFRREDGSVERLILARPGLDVYDVYKDEWRRGEESQWEAIARVVAERDPKSIGINCSETHQFADDLTYTEHGQLMAALGPTYAARTKWAERLAVGWLERRSPIELEAYPGIQHIAYGIIAEAFSSRVIHPGVTTCDDVVWWMRQRTQDLGLSCWFQPSVRIQRKGLAGRVDGGAAIMQGDSLHCDYGLHYLGLATDTQQQAYVLRFGENDAPAGLKAALATCNRLQDILAENMVAGRTGNKILAASLAQAKGENIKATIYTHPIGFHGHAAGPYIGLGDNQIAVPGTGEYELFDDTCYSFELNIAQFVPEWEQEVRIALETDVAFTGGKIRYLGGRQTQLHLIQ